MVVTNLRFRRAHLTALLVVPVALASGAPALGAATFRTSNHDWLVGVNAATVHSVAPGGQLTYCASQRISAVTPSITYTGAPVGRRYSEKVIGPTAAGTIAITSVRNVDGDVQALKFVASSGTWDNTYAVMSFPGSFGHPSLPPGTYKFEVFVSGKPVAMTSVKLVARPGC